MLCSFSLAGVIRFTGLSAIPCPSGAATTAWLVETFLRVRPLNPGSVAAGSAWLSEAMLVACSPLAGLDGAAVWARGSKSLSRIRLDISLLE